MASTQGVEAKTVTLALLQQLRILAVTLSFDIKVNSNFSITEKRSEQGEITCVFPIVAWPSTVRVGGFPRGEAVRLPAALGRHVGCGSFRNACLTCTFFVRSLTRGKASEASSIRQSATESCEY